MDNVVKKCYLKKKPNNFQKQVEGVNTNSILSPSPWSDDEDSAGPMAAMMNMHSLRSIGTLSDEETNGGISRGSCKNLKNYDSSTSTASNQRKGDDLAMLIKELDKEREENAELLQMWERQRSDMALLQDALDKEKSSKAKVKMALQSEKSARIDLQEAFDKEKSITASLEKALDEERSSTASLGEVLAEERSLTASFEKALAKEESATSALGKELLRKREDKAALYKSLQKRKVIISDFQATLAEEQSNSAKVQLKVETLASELKSCRKAKEQLKKNLARSERKLQEQVEANKKLVQEKDDGIGKFQDRVIELQKRHLNENASKLKIQTLQHDVSAKDRQLISLQAKVNQMSVDLIEEKDRNLRLQIDVAEAQTLHKRAEEESIQMTKEKLGHGKVLVGQVHTLGEIIRAKDELLALKDQIINQLKSSTSQPIRETSRRKHRLTHQRA